MKTVLLFCVCLVFVHVALAQSPGKFRYQAVARDQSGKVITGTVSLKVSFLEDGPNGAARYAESQSVPTDGQGVFSLVIGDGSPVSGSFTAMDWAHHQYWVEIAMKTPGDASYTPMGTTQLLSVPYALFAEKSNNDLSAGQGINIANGMISNTGDLDNTNELQTLSVNGDQLSLSNGNAVTLPTGTTYSPGAGIQISGNTISATDASPTNEIQTLSLNGQQLSLSNGGGSVQLPAAPPTSWDVSNNDIISTPSANSVVVGASGDFNSKLYVSATGTQQGGNFYAPGSGDAVHAYNNSTGAGVSAASLNGPGGYFSSTTGPALVTGTGRVGIGKANPTYKLDIAGGSYGGISVTSDEGFGIYCNTTANMAAGWFGGTIGLGGYFTSNDNYAIYVNQGGVGSATLHRGIVLNYGGAAWKNFVDAPFDYNWAYADVLKAWISHTDGSFHNSSDRALKKDIQPFSQVLPKLTKLQAYTYHMKDAPEDSPLSLGFMAQDVEQVFPELVVEKAGYKSLCYDHFAVLSVQAIKEQQVMIDDLKKEVDDLKLMVTALTAKQEALANAQK